MAQFFIRRPIVAMVIAIVTLVVGLVTLSRLHPPVSPTLIEATTTYRGAAAEAVMDSVATPSSQRSTESTKCCTCSHSARMTAR